MPRWLFIVAIAGITWLVLAAHDHGLTQRAWNSLADAELPNIEPAANHPASDRPQDAFQRAWNRSEKRVHKALRSKNAAD
jgi:hypothetical protein